MDQYIPCMPNIPMLNGWLPGKPPSKMASKKKAKRSGRGFPIADFVFDKLAENPKGLRAAQIAKLLVEAAPGAHVDPSAAASKTLTRLRNLGQVKNKDAIWTITKASRE